MRNYLPILYLLFLTGMVSCACRNASQEKTSLNAISSTTTAADTQKKDSLVTVASGAATPAPIEGPARHYKYKVLAQLPHNPNNYTQGFFFHDGCFYESTGQYGQSRLLCVDPKTGKEKMNVTLDGIYFGEGACLQDGRIYQLTWMEETCFVYDSQSLQKLGTAPYAGEGWGLTSNGKELILSNGTSVLSFLDPNSLMELRRITVQHNGKEVSYLNELEFIHGEIWANVYTSDKIVRINPENGQVIGIVDFTGLLPRRLRDSRTDVLNGIAYDYSTDRLWVTGKYWPLVFQVCIF